LKNKFKNSLPFEKDCLFLQSEIKKSTLYNKYLVIMIVVPVKEGENIERALKKFKRKFEKTGVVKELRRRQCFDKPSIVNRDEMMHAIYIEKKNLREE